MLVFNLLSFVSLATALVIPNEPLDLSSLDKRANDGIVSTPVTQNDFVYFMNVKVGSQGKLFTPLADTGSPITWVPNTDDWAHKSTSLINTTQPFFVAYVGTVKDYGFMIEDKFSFGDSNIDSFKFGYIDNPKTASWGIIGLSRWEGDHPGLPDSIRRYDNLPVYLKKQGTINHGIASLYYNPISKEGKFIFGGYDQAKVGSPWSIHKDPTTFKVPLTNVTVGGVTHKPEGGDYPIVVDTGGSSYLPDAILDPIASLYTNSHRESNMWIVDCNVRDTLFQLGFGDLVLNIPLKDFLFPHGPGQKQCQLAAFSSEKTNNLTLIGGAILNHVVTIFDYDNGVIKVANFKDTQEENIVKPE